LQAIKIGCGAENVEVMDERGRHGVDATLKEGIDATLKSGKKPVIVLDYSRLKVDELSKIREERDQQLRNNDARVDRLLSTLVQGKDYTVVYTSTPVNATISMENREDFSYQAEFMDPAHMDLKRDLDIRLPGKVVQTDERPLFEKYQFLTPGLFMGLLVGLVMLSILGVGLNAIASLKVSYGAFDKEMGPAAQRKQQ